MNGILVQMPVPDHVDDRRVLRSIDPEMDVDGLHPENIGRLVAGDARYKPCTPRGIQRLLAAADVETEGKDAVVVGDGAVEVDVGINQVDADSEKGYELVGDVDFESATEQASAITPVPGGVGPMTRAMLLYNTVNAAPLQSGVDSVLDE